MAQHSYKTTYKGEPVTIIAGWDVPLQQFFTVVELDNPPEDDENEGRVYSNLDDDKAKGCKDFNYFIFKLAEFGMTVPRALTEGVVRDQKFNDSCGDVVYKDDHGQ